MSLGRRAHRDLRLGPLPGAAHRQTCFASRQAIGYRLSLLGFVAQGFAAVFLRLVMVPNGVRNKFTQHPVS